MYLLDPKNKTGNHRQFLLSIILFDLTLNLHLTLLVTLNLHFTLHLTEYLQLTLLLTLKLHLNHNSTDNQYLPKFSPNSFP